ncbi:MAG: hypothetical protein DRP71_08385 [Verrucomicrobia bacterium]|nr:MAG: hypothetical protein DRP71_08385 [Verrucomicrobiota bacterium]
MARISGIVTVERDGLHNGFTDILFWQGAYWISFRKSQGHISPDGETFISVSGDGEQWRNACRIKIPGDNRDPRLIAVSENRMALIISTWMDGYTSDSLGFQRKRLLSFIMFSEDGHNWTEPRQTLPENRWLWKIRRFNDRYYAANYGLTEGATWSSRRISFEFMASDDLVNWEKVSDLGEGDFVPIETDMAFREDGEVWLVSRNDIKTSGMVDSHFSSALPPYTNWETVNLGTVIHSPELVTIDRNVYLAGRCDMVKDSSLPWPYPREWSMALWKLGRGAVEPILYFPACGDCSYPGMLVDPNGNLCISYYSQHAYGMGVIPSTSGFEPADIFFAKIDLSE